MQRVDPDVASEHKMNPNPLRPTWVIVVQVMAAALVLNALTSFNNIYPTPYVQLGTQIGPEFVALWVVLLVWVAVFRRVGRVPAAVLTGLFVLVVVGRYADVTVPAWLGRRLNLYWDAYHLPKFLEVASQSFTWWQVVGIVVAGVAGFWLLLRVVNACIRVLADHAARAAVRSPLAWISSAVLVGVAVAGTMKIEPLERYVSAPVFPVYQRQAGLLIAAFSPTHRENVLPASAPLQSDLRVLEGAEVKVVFLESYGATTYDRAEIFEALQPARERLEATAHGQGRQVLSAFVRAATFGGASDLSHLSFLSGIDLTDPFRHDVLLTSERPTMLDTFEQAGYLTIGLYPAMSWDWPEKSFYGFDVYRDAPSLEYRGPKFGLWWLPDQFSLARINELYPADPEGKPRFLFYPTITSHIPYRPTPPYQPDWSRVTSSDPFTAEDTATAMADRIDWNDLFSGYINTMTYTFEWLSGYLEQPQKRESVLILIGDHQPAGGVTGPEPTWDVPVHVITGNPMIAARLRARGFSDGVNPKRDSLGHISELAKMLLSVFDSGGSGFEDSAALVDTRTGEQVGSGSL
jgi:hypothetical protein